MADHPALADNHVHTQFSWDAPQGDMDATCRRAVALGLPSIAFTDHADWVRGSEAVFDPTDYFLAIESCRRAYPGLRILSGIEMGEPHLHPVAAQAMLALPFERVLASVHCVVWNGRATDACEKGFLAAENVDTVYRLYLREVMDLLESDQSFQVLAHLDYPKRFWPAEPAHSDAQYEDEYRAILRAAAKRGTVLEVNTTRGREPERFLCPGPTVLGWWREEGGRAVSFGSDAHSPDKVAAGFKLAQDLVTAAGFKPDQDPTAFWTKQ